MSYRAPRSLAPSVYLNPVHHTLYSHTHTHFLPSPHSPHSPSTARVTLLYLPHLLHPECSHPGHFSPSTKLASTPFFTRHAQHTQRDNISLLEGRSEKGQPDSECVPMGGLMALRRRIGSGDGEEGGDGGAGGWYDVYEEGMPRSAIRLIMLASVAGGSRPFFSTEGLTYCCWRTCCW
jgi:hypothetical protein